LNLIRIKRSVTITILAAVLCSLTAPLQAEEKVLSLHEIMALAREHNGELKALREEAGVGAAARIKAGLYPNPVLDLEGATGALSGSPDEHRIAVGLSQEFLIGAKLQKRLAVADAEAARLDSRIKDAERTLRLELKTGYYELLLAEGRHTLALRSLELNKQLLHVTKERFAAGDTAEMDVNLARVETARSEGRKIEAEHELVPPRQRLVTLIGTTLPEPLKPAGPVARTTLKSSLAELKALSLRTRPDLQAAVSERDKGQAELALAHTEGIPNLTAGIVFSRESTLTSLGGRDERSTDYLIGLKLSAPLPFFDRNQAGIKEAQARKSGAEIRRTLISQNIEREVESAYARLVAAEKTLDIYAREIVPQLTDNQKLVMEAYQAGEVGIMAVLEEQKKFIEVHEAYLAAQHNRNLALAKLDAAVGTELIESEGVTP